MLDAISPVSLDTVVGESAKLKAGGYRFVTMSCTALDDNSVDIVYHFDKNLQLRNLRLTAAKNAAVPSISTVYFAAFLVENEIQDLFGIRFEGLVIDYERTLYLDGEVTVTPFCKYAVKRTHDQAAQTAPETGAMTVSED
jgi:ech hydrogenase subunit D